MTADDSLPAETAGEVASAFLPGTGGIVTRMFTAIQNEWSRNRSVALRVAERTSGLSREDLAERVEQTPELVPLVTRLLWEAAMTGQTGLLEAMGAAFGSAVAEPGREPDYELILGGLRNLRAEDVRILREIRDRSVFDNSGDETVEETGERQTTAGLRTRLQVSRESLTFGLTRLANQGFATAITVYSGERYEITNLGRLLYDALERMNDG